MKDPFSVLGVPRTADDAAIKTAFRNLAKEHHPDKEGGSEARFKEINEAFQAIDTAAKRAELAAKEAPKPEFNWRDLNRAGFGSRGGAAFYDTETLDSIKMFEELMRRRQEAARRNEDIVTEVKITLLDALNGCSVNLNIEHPKTGPRQLVVKIPPGIDGGQRIRVQGQGNNTHDDRPPADLYVVPIIDHLGFGREGPTLFKTVTADALNLMITKTAFVETLDGKTLEFVVPTAVSGQLIRLKEQGMPLGINSPRRGDLIIELKISVETDLTDEQKKLAVQILDLQKS